MKYGLTETTVENICAVFARFPEIEKAILYGSRAKGNFKPGSDIDLTLCGEALTSDLRSTIASALDDLLLPYTIDLSIFNEINHAKLREHIERVGVLFYERANHGTALKKGWQIRKLGDLLEVQNGYAFSSKDYSESGHFVMRIGNVQNGYISSADPKFISLPADGILQRFVLSEGDILVSLTGNVGRVGVIQKEHLPAALNQRVARMTIRKNSPAYREFLLFFLYSDWFREELTGAGHGAAQQNVSTKDLIEIQLPVPPLPEQKRIVGILAEANAEKNLQNARALFESHLQSVFTQRGVGWVDTPLGNVCGFVRGPFGGSLKKSIFVADGYAVYEQQHAIYNQFDDVRYFIDEAKFREMKRFELLPNDLIMSCSGTMGRVAIVPKGIKRGIINQALLKLTPTAKISCTFLKSWMESEAFQDALKEYSGGAAIQNVASVKILKEIRVPLPSIKEQERVVDKLDALSAETQRLEAIYKQKLAALEALKKSLLHQAFSGHL
jgi:type I restriction enzyme S subunit